MLLTLKPPLQNGFRSFHEYSPPLSSSTTRFPQAVTNGSPKPADTLRPMATPHRGLPPPAAMAMNPQDRGPPSIGQPMGQLPAPPQQWQGAEESMRNWLNAKAEEDKRKQEEEKTRQETLRLEQRKIEQAMLRDSLAGNIPPYMVPLIFAGMGGGNLPNASLEWAQHYMAQNHQLQQHYQQLQQQALPQQQASPPELRREQRVITQPQPNPYGPSQQQPPVASPAVHTQPRQSAAFVPTYSLTSISPSAVVSVQQAAAAQATAPTSAPRPPVQSSLPRLNTGEMQIQQPPAGPSAIQMSAANQSIHPLHQTQAAQQQQDQQSTSPALFFHHWQPPTSQASSSQNTPSGKNTDSPHAHNTTSQKSEYTTSPKKRKAQGGHEPKPPPSHYTSPPFSQSSAASTPSGRRRAHSQQLSDVSTRAYDSHGRPVSRQRQSDAGSAPGSGTTGTSSGQQPTPATTASDDRRIGLRRQSSSQPESRQSQPPPQRYSAGPESRREHDTTSDREGSSNNR
ncbi:MAG: hypothetical protein M1836_005898 [Candelina mexicana]|nr:MAG: hypothetical protein M1836_005898 [Candelina mexicana]